MDRVALSVILLLVAVPYFGIYPACLFKNGRLSGNSLIVYLTFTFSMIFLAAGAVLDSLALVLLSLLALVLTGVLSRFFRKNLEEDAYSVEVNPREPLKLVWFFRLDASLWVWLAYRIGSTRAAFLNVLVTYVAVIGVIALLNHLSNGHFPLKSFSVVYAIVMILQFRKVYQNLYERTKKD
ncbi:hypothetical protein [Thermococcus aciditolerans]|uniref:Uncharacterized protein n=1 Tax=Thermococcus aciditolerans TaxID=2598455 RepID=A0A5C0SJ25_9EURY|nr:hypothetical protein [Thermococcus aciditolerans]QEK13992.1 hypothetical protein FPV09_01385 [Thermococcus aciditolerans]